jgi:replicative DNA helicase
MTISSVKASSNSKQKEVDLSPRALHIERSVLGIILQRDSAFYELVAVGLTDELFSFDGHRAIFRSMRRLVDGKKQPVILAVCDDLENQKQLKAVGGFAYLSDLVDGNVEPLELKQYVEILREKYLRRQLIKLSERVTACAADLSDPVDWTIRALQDDLLELQGGIAHEGYSLGDFDESVLSTLKDQIYSPQETVGLPFGIRDLDEHTTGIRDAEFIPLGGLPGSGKTAFACHIARVNAQRGTPVGFFSIEMTKDQLLHRFWAQASDIPYSALRNPKNLPLSALTELEQKWMPEVRKWPIKVDDNTKDIGEIIPRAHLWVRRFGVKLIIIDFLQRIHAPGKTEYEIVSYAADALTEFAKQTKIPVLCLSQLTRGEDKKNAANQVPTMQMLRASGRIEQNAHLVLFTHRPENDEGAPNGEDLIIVAKQRAGVKGRIKARFDGSSQRWEERE